MIPRRHNAARRSEVQRCLARAAGVRIFQPSPGADREPEFERLCAALAGLGAVFSAFGTYLSTRADLLPRTERTRLAQLGGAVEPLAPSLVRQAIADELGADGVAIESLCDEPFDSRLLFQRHHGRLSNGNEVVVRLVRRDRFDEGDLDLLPLVRDMLAPHLVDAHLFAQAVDDFRAHCLAQVNGRTLAEGLELLRRDVRGFESLCVPEVYHELTTSRLLVVSRLPGRRLGAPLAAERSSATSNEGAERSGRAAPAGSRTELARLVCEVWLRQVSDGGIVPVEMCPENVVALSSSEIGLDEGSFVVLPQDTRVNLLNYLVAVAVDEPHKALECLLKEFDGTQRRIPPEQLDRLFRQMVPEDDAGGPTTSLAGTVLAQWRLAMQNGYWPHRQTVALLRGLMQLIETAQSLAPRRDPLLEGLKDLRVARLLNEISTLIEPTYWFGRLDKIVGLLLSAPRVVDDALSASSSDQTWPGRPVPAANTRRSSAPAWVAPALLLAAGALAHGEGEKALGGPASEALSAAVVLVAGAWLLRSIVASGV